MIGQARTLAATAPLGALVAAAYGWALTRLAIDASQRVRTELRTAFGDVAWPGLPR